MVIKLFYLQPYNNKIFNINLLIYELYKIIFFIIVNYNYEY